MPVARIGLLLRLQPSSLEEEFWAASGTRRQLCILDGIASAMVLPKLAGGLLGRIQPSLPVDMQLPWGAKVMLIGYFILSQLPVVLMLSHFNSYRRWRFWLVLANRVYRLCAIIVLAQPGTVLGYVTQVTAVRKAVLAGQPYKALLINTLLPTASHLQHTNYVLPFRYSLPFQTGILLVGVMWAKGMPCWLPLPRDNKVAAGSSSSYSSSYSSSSYSSSSSSTSFYFGQLPDAVLLPWEVGPSGDSASHASWAPTGTASTAAADAGAAVEAFEQAGSHACQALQVIHALVWAPMAPPQAGIATSAQALCQGAAAFQLMYLFTAALLLLVVPLASVYCLEKMAKRHWCRSQGITVKPARIWGVRDDSIGTGEGEDELRWQLPKVPVLLVVVLLVSSPWKLAESLTASMESQCGATSGSSILAWLGSFC